jgi:hypothetical protein
MAPLRRGIARALSPRSPGALGETNTLTEFPWKRFVVWGYRLHEHTHSYIHEAFVRAARWMGIDTSWLPDEPADPGGFDETLFLTEGQVDRHLPVRDDCFYIVHNWDPARELYAPIRERRNYLALQVFLTDVLDWPVEPIDGYPGAYALAADRTVFAPWGTDLLPPEIDRQRERLVRLLGRRRGAAWVGSIGEGEFGNAGQLRPYVDEARALGLEWTHRVRISRKEHVRTIERALLAPAIVGAWQLEHGYIPCRIFKNASYGHLGATNSKVVRDLFPEGLCLWSEDTAELCRMSYARATETPAAEQAEAIVALMDEVRARHTYASRIRMLLDVIREL